MTVVMTVPDEKWRPATVMDPPTTFRHKVRAEELTSAITPNDDVFVLAHFGVPHFDAMAWRLRVEGLVKKPVALTLTNELYNDPAPGGGTAPVWQVAPEALIVSPADHDKIVPGRREIWGWCWGEYEIAQVDVSLDDGQSWRGASVEPRRQMAWQRFSLMTDCAPGSLTIMARATDIRGQTQPPRAARNAIHAVKVSVT